ncbi:hypothetical protein [Pseudoalteromonas luteoviolacea]|uniref:Uncharacterized protein n=1 Tax=Pseudoalteromonas luteoviolacea S4054 TaxID=1129367 RepID=A0A0F6AFP4_9GAMM|nr:hypothetical protein [Pseudoalteromonas luteoviolacea]AOT09259.1 hypothetical protein S4054249_16015 [Pseudoalteromonas luteoviolacea]AOT14171.1 hypothetical protein S40542_15985 [Pseudoalteromonas luteoviolacea]AOT19087.1 hypothetical protein S4054_15990 [Pseudoalteromonas luteoviolacea]KKE85032.1 hypothetical protein N479_06255 [Pseudoalteromonas luteoviolacea S4054]KZN70150.1 hypothetical protein N481_01365 [Pseudoalteromonas luteoviolacea S4047-1]
MANEFDWLLNSLLLVLGFGALFINHKTLLRAAAAIACSLLFVLFSLDLMDTSVISNLGLILINSFYLFKVFTLEHYDTN